MREPHERMVLVVEDDVDVREALVEVLADHEFPSVEAANGKEALEKLKGGVRPCVILLDVMMPLMDGAEFRRHQRADPDLSAIPVVVLTAHANGSAAAAEMDAQGYLRKPVELDNLIGTVCRFC